MSRSGSSGSRISDIVSSTSAARNSSQVSRAIQPCSAGLVASNPATATPPADAISGSTITAMAPSTNVSRAATMVVVPSVCSRTISR